MKKDHLAETLESFESGLSCSQAVVGAFSEDYGLSRDIAFKISCPLGEGMEDMVEPAVLLLEQ